MTIINDEQKYNIKLLWFTLLQALYSFPPIQRVVLVVGIIIIIPGYWSFRLGAKYYYNWSYQKQEIIASASFSNPQALKINNSHVFPLQTGKYIAYAKIENPNLDLAADSIPFTFKISNSNKETVYESSGRTFILPGSAQYIVSRAFEATDENLVATVIFNNPHWQKRLVIPSVPLSTPAISFSDSEAGLKVEGSVINNSAYELSTVTLTFLIYDNDNALIGVTQRDEFDLRPRTKRAFPQTWPGLIIASEVGKIDAIASTNVLSSKNLKVEVGSIEK